MYKNESVPLKPILEYLKSAEQKIEEEIADQHFNSLLVELEKIIGATDAKNSIISIEDIAKKFNIPTEAAIRIIKSEAGAEEKKIKNDNHDKVDDTKFVMVGKYLVLRSKANELKSLLESIKSYKEASLLLTKNGILEEIHVELISRLGFNIIWKGIDYNTATIEKKDS